jgi:Spy/CpxP family protein refolding chaperone
MNRNIVHTLLVGILLVVVAGTTGVLAQPPTPCDAGRAMEVLTRFLDLTEDQREDFVTILKESHEMIKPLEEQQRALRRELDGILDAGGYDLALVGAYAEQIHDLGHQIRDIRKDMVKSLIEDMDEEQLRKSGIVRRAAVLQPVINAFKVLGILPPIVPPPAPPEPPEE